MDFDYSPRQQELIRRVEREGAPAPPAAERLPEVPA